MTEFGAILDEALSHAEDARARVRLHLREMSVVEFKPPDDDSSEEISILDLTIADTWKPLIVMGQYCGSMKRVSNGNSHNIGCMWRWNGDEDGSMPMHKHPHQESFLVRKGKLIMEYRGNRYTYRTGEGRRFGRGEPHAMAWCEPGTEVFIMWWADGS